MTRQRIRDIRHQELIEATIIAMHRHGYSAVTMAEIADVAQSSAASINYYFGSKNKLMEATMRHLLSMLREAVIARCATAASPRARLRAVVEANFDDRLFTVEHTNIWMQFWANAPFEPSLSRLQRINRARVRSHFRAELRKIAPKDHRETIRLALQAYMDGVWLSAAQSDQPLDAAKARREARAFMDILLPQEV